MSLLPRLYVLFAYLTGWLEAHPALTRAAATTALFVAVLALGLLLPGPTPACDPIGQGCGGGGF